MNDLTLIEKRGKPYADSREVAEMIGKKHSHLLRDIEKYINVISENPTLDSQSFFVQASYKSIGNNRTYPMYYLTRKGCDMVANKLTGGKGILFTAVYVDRFHAMEGALRDRKEAREQGKLVRRGFTDAIKLFIELAESQGHHGTAKNAYCNLTRLVKKQLGTREDADAGQLAMIAAMEEFLKANILPLVSAGLDAKAIFQTCKERSEAFAGIARLTA